MKRFNKYFLTILTVCLVSGVFLFMSMLALNDIYHNVETSFVAEWNLVRLSYFVNGLLYLAIILTFFKFRRALKNSH